jgi:hypothetical protein
MLFGPENFNNFAQAEMQYSQLSTASWADCNTTIEYTYDANGSLETKTTRTTGGAAREVITNTYNLAGRLSRVVTDPEPSSATNIVDVTDYTYNDAGIRVRKYAFSVAQNYLDTGDEQPNATDKQTIIYLTDSYNHTGYAQTLEELTYDKADPDIGTDTPDSMRTYTIVDDVISQKTDGVSQYLLYDGHGSTRQLAIIAGDMSVTIIANYSYDAYAKGMRGQARV